MAPIFLALAMLAQAAEQPPSGGAAPAEPPRTQLRLPFETGQATFRVEIWASGAMRCTGGAQGAAFEGIAGGLCAEVPVLSPDAAVEGDLISRVTTAITLTRAGDAASALPPSPDPQSFDTQAEIEVRPDGSVAACRLSSETRSAQSNVPVQPEGLCGDLIQSLPFLPWTGDGPRRGSIRLTIFSAGPDRLGQRN